MRYHGIEKYFWAIRENWLSILVCFPIGAAIGAIFSIITFDFSEILNAVLVCMVGLGGIGAFGNFLESVLTNSGRDGKEDESGMVIACIMFGTSYYVNHSVKEYGNVTFFVVFAIELLFFDCVVENKMKKLDVEDAIKEAEEKYKIQIEYKNWMQSAGTVRDIADQINLNLQLKEREWHESQKES